MPSITSQSAQIPLPPTTANVGTTSTQIVALNASRTGLCVINLSENFVSLAFGHPAAKNYGVTLFPGESFSMDAFLFTTENVNAIAEAAGSILSIQEFS